MSKVIITCAVTGAIHTPSMSPYLPVTPEEIIEASVGAAIIHLHARDPITGKPDQSPEAFAKFLPQIKARTNAALNLTSGGSPFMKIDERIQPSLRFAPEVASLNMGSINFALFPMLERFKTFQHPWEKEHLARLDLQAHTFTVTPSDASQPPITRSFRALPEAILAILREGGLIPFLKKYPNWEVTA